MYLVGVCLFFFIFMVISASFYQGGISWQGRFYDAGFSFYNAAISNLGNPILNPGGWVFFSIMMIGSGILFFPHVRYLYHAIRPVAPKFAKVFLFLLCLTPVGMIGAGIINEDMFFAVHYALGGLCFGGIGLAAILGFFFSIIRMKRHEPWPTLGRFTLLYGIVIAGLVYLASEAIIKGTSDPRALHLPEWVMFVTMLAWLVGFYLLVPGKKEVKDMV